MNLFAHAVMAGSDPVRITAGIIADRVKGRVGLPVFDCLPESAQSGVIQHRVIDEYTDSHPLQLRARELFAPPGRRIAGILLDLYGDWVLYNHWDRWNLGVCEDRLQMARNALDSSLALFPAESVKWGRSILRNDLLSACAHTDGLHLTALQLGARMSWSPLFKHGLLSLQKHQVQLNEIYLEFMDELFANPALR